MRQLNQRQRLFCDWYIKLGGERFGTEAAKRAGFSKKTASSIASELLTRPKIQAYLAVRRTQMEELLGFNKSTILQDLHTIKSRSMQAVPVMVWDRDSRQMVQVMEINDEGEEVGVYEFDSQGANRSIENINKIMGYNESDKVEDVTPVENKPSTIVINKTYVNQEPDKSTT